MVVNSLAAEVTGGMIYVEPPGEVGHPSAALPEPRSHLQPDGWRYHFPWVKTAVSAPAYNTALLIANRTEKTWLLWHNYHSLGMLEAGIERRVRVVRTGTLSARQLLAGPQAEYLLVSLAYELVAVEIADISGGEGIYELRRMQAGHGELSNLPDSTKLKELKLSARAENVLKRIGILTVGDLKRADLGALWEVRNGAAAYAELVELLYLGGPSQ